MILTKHIFLKCCFVHFSNICSHRIQFQGIMVTVCWFVLLAQGVFILRIRVFALVSIVLIGSLLCLLCEQQVPFSNRAVGFQADILPSSQDLPEFATIDHWQAFRPTVSRPIWSIRHMLWIFLCEILIYAFFIFFIFLHASFLHKGALKGCLGSPARFIFGRYVLG